MSTTDPLELYRRMVLIRHFEETTIEVYRSGEMPGLAHSYAGQEASAVGICAALRPDDTITSTHRGHGHILAKGASPARMMLEIMGKEGGYCAGRGGSMHITDVSLGVLGANGVVAGGVGIALGSALSAERLGADRVSVCFIGDGAMNQGITFEVLNMAALWKLPLIVVCENNLYGQYSPLSDVLHGEVADRPRAFGIEPVTADGMDVDDVLAVATEQVGRTRAGHGPAFIEVRTYRYGGHHVAEVKSDYRTDEEIHEWRGRDPLELYRRRLLSRGHDEQALDAIRVAAEGEVERARQIGLDGAEPDPSALTDEVYA